MTGTRWWLSACARLGGGAGAARQDLSCALGKARSGRGAGTSRPASVSAPSCGTPLPPAGSEPCRCPRRSADAPPFSGRQCEPPPAQPSSPQRPSLSSAPLCRGTSGLSLLLSPSRQAHPVPRLLFQGHHDPHVSGSHGPALLAAGNRKSVTLGPESPHPWTLPLTPPWQQPCLCPQTSALVSSIHTPSPGGLSRASGPQARFGPSPGSSPSTHCTFLPGCVVQIADLTSPNQTPEASPRVLRSFTRLHPGQRLRPRCSRRSLDSSLTSPSLTPGLHLPNPVGSTFKTYLLSDCFSPVLPPFPWSRSVSLWPGFSQPPCLFLPPPPPKHKQ